MQPILEVQALSKKFHNAVALENVTLQIPRGKIFGLLGPNGAGKTTLIRIITQILGPDSGKVLLNGEPLSAQHRSAIGYMPEERGLYKKMKVGEQLIYLAQLKGLTKEEARTKTIAWMRKLDIGNWWHKKVDELSKGMSQKIQFISTIVHDPALIILDEPFSGLDPINANLIKNEIMELKEKGATIIFSTHRMESVEEMCDHIALVNKGHIILEGAIGEIQQTFKKQHYEVLFEGETPDLAAITKKFSIVHSENGKLIFQVPEEETANSLLKSLLAVNINIHGFRELLPSVNDIFIEKVGSYA